MPSAVHALAPAKVNLALSVGAPDATGMHPISSWMVTVDLCDELHVETLSAGSRSLYALLWHDRAPRKRDIDWSISRDLSVRAHQLLEAHVGQPLPVKMRLEKRIPVGGGLGGGSSDAAAMLRAVNALYQLGLDAEALVQVARPLGSDVPFLVRGGSAVVEGLGERLTPVPMPSDLHAVLVFPPAACPTGPVYRAFDQLQPRALLQAERVHAMARAGAPAAHEPFNDLADAAKDVAPSLVGECEEILELIDRPVHVSGSGSTLYFLCDGPVESELLAQAVRERLGTPTAAVKAMVTPEPVVIEPARHRT
jgi:4-diphosphocytidyl-2-C-methyl-D-erythritol kinase